MEKVFESGQSEANKKQVDNTQNVLFDAKSDKAKKEKRNIFSLNINQIEGLASFGSGLFGDYMLVLGDNFFVPINGNTVLYKDLITFKDKINGKKVRITFQKCKSKLGKIYVRLERLEIL